MSTSMWFPFICFVFVQAALPTNSSAQELQNLLSTVNGTLNSMGSSLEEMNTTLMFQIHNNAVLKSTVESISSLVNSACILNDCPKYWNKHGESCYQYGQCNLNSPCSADNARTACEGQNASLAIVKSEEDNDFVISLFGAGVRLVFIGARDSEMERTWVWPDGSSVTYINWDYDEPGNNNVCAMIYKFTKKWYAVKCNGVLYRVDSGYVCEKQITSFCNNQR